jgi:hypothetical protein
LPGGLICWGVDVISGGGYHLVPEQVHVTLKPLTEESEQVVEHPKDLSVTKLRQPIIEAELN